MTSLCVFLSSFFMGVERAISHVSPSLLSRPNKKLLSGKPITFIWFVWKETNEKHSSQGSKFVKNISTNKTSQDSSAWYRSVIMPKTQKWQKLCPSTDILKDIFEIIEEKGENYRKIILCCFYHSLANFTYIMVKIAQIFFQHH